MSPWRGPAWPDAAPWTLEGEPAPASRLPDRVLAVAATPRSGSTLLARALAATGELGVPEEYFNTTAVSEHRDEWGLPRLSLRGKAGVVRRRLEGHPEWWISYGYSRRSQERYRDAIMERTTSPSGWFAVKTHWFDYAVFQHGPWDPETWGLPVHWIRVQRRDALRQAVSLVRARQTGLWEATMTPRGQAAYDRDAITTALRRIREWEQQWDGFFSERGIAPLTLVYEEIAHDYQGQLRRALDHLGLTSASVPGPAVRRQSDGLTRAWMERFLTESRDADVGGG